MDHCMPITPLQKSWPRPCRMQLHVRKVTSRVHYALHGRISWPRAQRVMKLWCAVCRVNMKGVPEANTCLATQPTRTPSTVRHHSTYLIRPTVWG